MRYYKLSHQVAHHHVAVLGLQLAARLLRQVLGLGGEADQQAVALLAAQFGQDIGRGIEFQRDARGGLLDLLVRAPCSGGNRPPRRP